MRSFINKKYTKNVSEREKYYFKNVLSKDLILSFFVNFSSPLSPEGKGK